MHICISLESTLVSWLADNRHHPIIRNTFRVFLDYRMFDIFWKVWHHSTWPQKYLPTYLSPYPHRSVFFKVYSGPTLGWLEFLLGVNGTQTFSNRSFNPAYASPKLCESIRLIFLELQFWMPIAHAPRGQVLGSNLHTWPREVCCGDSELCKLKYSMIASHKTVPTYCVDNDHDIDVISGYNMSPLACQLYLLTALCPLFGSMIEKDEKWSPASEMGWVGLPL